MGSRPEAVVLVPSCKLERKTVEKNRRILMKSLCSQLASLIPITKHSKEATSQQEQLMQATVYIEQQRQHIEEMKKKRDRARLLIMGTQRKTTININMKSSSDVDVDSDTEEGLLLPASVQIRGEFNSNLEVVLISGLVVPYRFKLSEVSRVLVEEGVEVTTASSAVFGDRIVHILHLRVTNSRVGFERATLYGRLKELVMW